jgi:hypothetical protein
MNFRRIHAAACNKMNFAAKVEKNEHWKENSFPKDFKEYGAGYLVVEDTPRKYCVWMWSRTDTCVYLPSYTGHIEGYERRPF